MQYIIFSVISGASWGVDIRFCIAGSTSAPIYLHNVPNRKLSVVNEYWRSPMGYDMHRQGKAK